jgi:hypothetical protein
MIGVAVDVAHFAVAQMHTDAAAACAHVAGGALDLLIVKLVWRRFGPHDFSSTMVGSRCDKSIIVSMPFLELIS